MNKYYYDEHYFQQIDSEHKAYWLGFLYADGHIEPLRKGNKIKAYRIEIGLSAVDKSHLELFLHDIDSNAPLTYKKTIIRDKTYESCRVRINNTNMCRDLISLGCVPQKSLTLTFPSEELLPGNYVRHFIRGYFDGDGCISYTTR
ncbi:LAGLIDADG family homing endonuclease, partial [Lachnospiraceae bacterium OttesenSCG-928-D06]|nr:LAGLIDADG family homing endonuclease [Lachnospiraceae bacterium OttesenSCG-928-D06]